MTTRMQQRRGTALEWLSINPVLTLGEHGFETDTKKFKVGNGLDTWTNLPYYLNEDQLPDVAAIVAAAQTEISTQVQALVATSIATALAGLVDSAPAALDTLNELAAAIADDATFANTITNALANKADDVHTHTKSEISDFSHTHTKAEISDFAHTHQYADLSGVAPSSHTHDASEILNTTSTITTTTYTIQSSDNGKMLILNPTGGAITVTVNNALTPGQRVDVYLQGTSATFVAGTGQIQSIGLTMANQYSVASIMCISTGVYALVGSVE